jgi:hypothetical protein
MWLRGIAFVVSVLLILMPTNALADCTYNGKQYSEGSRVGAFVCQQGRWVVKN